MNHAARPLIIAFASPKGGVGKSTSCLNIAAALCAHGYPVHVIDLDQTQSLYRWFSTRNPEVPGLTVESVPEAEFIPALKDATSRRSGFILIDVAGALGQAMIQAATIADLTITPTKLSELDLQEANKLHAKILDVAEQVGTTHQPPHPHQRGRSICRATSCMRWTRLSRDPAALRHAHPQPGALCGIVHDRTAAALCQPRPAAGAEGRRGNRPAVGEVFAALGMQQQKAAA